MPLINNHGKKLPGELGLLFLSTDEQEIRAWKGLDVKDNVFEIVETSIHQ
jgi:hypothetical protein